MSSYLSPQFSYMILTCPLVKIRVVEYITWLVRRQKLNSLENLYWQKAPNLNLSDRQPDGSLVGSTTTQLLSYSAFPVWSLFTGSRNFILSILEPGNKAFWLADFSYLPSKPAQHAANCNNIIFFLHYLPGFYLLFKAHVAAEGKIQYYNLVPRAFSAHPRKALGTRL